MPGILEHVLQFGGQTIYQKPFDELDALVLSQLVYMPMEGHMPPGEKTTVAEAWRFLEAHVPPESLDRFDRKRRELFGVCASQPRCREWVMENYVNIVDRELEMQFCACTWVLPGGLRCIAFRGTDGHLAGWKEDFNLSFMIVPAQHEAARYVLDAVRDSRDAFVLCGHSKGGNLALYAGATADAQTLSSIRRVYTFDGPGLDEETFRSDGYARVYSRVESYIPQSSIVGMLLFDYPSYTVVQSSAFGILQHNAMTWQVKDGAFVTLPRVDAASRLTDEALHAWLDQVEPAQRKLLADTLYEVTGASQAETLSDFSAEPFESAARMLGALRGLDSGVKRDVLRMIQLLFRAGAGSAVKELVSTLLKLRGTKSDG